MNDLVENLEPPFYAAILYDKTPPNLKLHQCHVMAFDELVSIASCQPGFLGLETQKYKSGQWSTISYWRDFNALKSWIAEGDKKIRQMYPNTSLSDACTFKTSKITENSRPRKTHSKSYISGLDKLKNQPVFIDKTRLVNFISRCFEHG